MPGMSLHLSDYGDAVVSQSLPLHPDRLPECALRIAALYEVEHDPGYRKEIQMGAQFG
jgi:hypothetical protein